MKSLVFQLFYDDAPRNLGLFRFSLKELSKNQNPTVRDWARECVAQKLLSGSQASIEKSIHRIKNSLIFNGRIEPGIGRGVFVPVIPIDGDVENL